MLIRPTIFILSICLVVSACRSHKSASSGDNEQATVKKFDTDDLIWRAKKQIGVHYKSGGNTPKGFDCSGFTRYCFEPFGIKLSGSAAQQAEMGKNIAPDKAEKGDLIFFKGGNEKSKVIGHVGIVVSGTGAAIKFIHASTSKGIMISGLDEKYFKARFVRIKRMK